MHRFLAHASARRTLLRLLAALVCGLLLFLLNVAWAAPPKRVVYTVTVADTASKTFRVQIRAEGVTDPAVRFALPAWTPGWYVLQNFEQDIADVRATGDDNAFRPVTPVDARTWSVAANGARSVTLSYDVKASDRGFGFFRTYLDATNGFLNGPAALMYVVDGKTAPCRITYRVPEGWRVASANDPVPGDPNTFTAPDYDTLVDQPTDLGRFVRYDRTLGGVPVSIVLVGAPDGVDTPATSAFADDVFKITEAGLRVLGKAPFPRYVYHFRFSPRAGGHGLEHLNGTVISLNAAALSGRASQGVLSLIAHEFVHAWNVKRVRPAALGPFDYTKPVRVTELWFAEGVTEYYAPRLLVAAGLGDRVFWRNYIAREIADLQNNPARTRVTLEDASLKVWESGDTSSGFGGLSYYNKGMLVGLLLDIELRARTNNRAGLDDLMAALLRESEQTGRGFAPGGIEATASKLAGADLSPFFQRALRSTEELPFAETLAIAGLRLRETVRAAPQIGILWDTGTRLADVLPGSEAEAAGLRAGDMVVAADGAPLSPATRAALLRNKRIGDTIVLLVRRGNDPPRSVAVTIGRREDRTYRLTEAPDPTPEQRAILASLTGETKKS